MYLKKIMITFALFAGLSTTAFADGDGKKIGRLYIPGTELVTPTGEKVKFISDKNEVCEFSVLDKMYYIGHGNGIEIKKFRVICFHQLFSKNKKEWNGDLIIKYK